MSDLLFSKSVTELAKSVQHRSKFDETLSSIVEIDKADKMITYLTKSNLCSDLWELRASVLSIELMNQDIYDDETALDYIGKLHVVK